MRARFASAAEIALVVGAPLLLALVEAFHPHPDDLMALDVRTWLLVHYAQIVLFPLAALGLATLVRNRHDIAATVCRIALFIFAISYTAFDTAAGVVTGILVRAARASSAPDSWRAPIDAVWSHPIMGGSPQLAAPLLAVMGSVALSVSAVAAAVTLRRGGHGWAPLGLLVLASFGIAIFKTHAWPGGPFTFGGIGLVCAWLLWERRHPARQPAGP